MLVVRLVIYIWGMYEIRTSEFYSLFNSTIHKNTI
nr:MAG TPA: hypothetical protein [Crassvirales sp.]DAQ98839.1 MAG TPA: hypothetical protein [Crassvirales sp.]